jgi:hypothetical protein
MCWGFASETIVKRKLIMACAALAMISSCSQLGRNEVPSTSPRSAEIHQALDETVIPEVDLENVTAKQALETWSQDSRIHNPKHFKFQHVVSYPMAFTQGAAKPSVASQKPAKVTIRRKNITSKRLLDEICHQSNLTWTVAGRVILIKPSTETPVTP